MAPIWPLPSLVLSIRSNVTLRLQTGAQLDLKPDYWLYVAIVSGLLYCSWFNLYALHNWLSLQWTSSTILLLLVSKLKQAKRIEWLSLINWTPFIWFEFIAFDHRSDYYHNNNNNNNNNNMSSSVWESGNNNLNWTWFMLSIWMSNATIEDLLKCVLKFTVPIDLYTNSAK